MQQHPAKTMEKTRILTALQIQQKIERIAHQLYEDHSEEKELIFVGVEQRGAALARRIAALMGKISDISIRYYSIELDKDHPLDAPVVFDVEVEDVEGRTVVLVDDVLNSGRTLMYAVRHILQAEVKSLATVVLVDRRHRRYPIRADYAGLTLSTTLQEHIAVELNDDPTQDAVYLT